MTGIRLLATPWLMGLAGCAVFGGGGDAPPERPSNACEIFAEKEDWYPAARKAAERWGVPIALQLAFIKQESGFQAEVRPPRQKFLGLIPTTRPSSAYGFGQALESTWEGYERATGNGGADRDDFGDVTDFIGWYCSISHQKLGIAKHDAYNQYLAYHEGQGGYARRTFESKGWLVKVARRVEMQTQQYGDQLIGCVAELESGNE